ncbi:MAG: thiamine pyrophosphate-binding protein [Candidatus Kariarchaeaceae archaeon]|jgi:acetolactate synthase-1/2/3 large subunit
MSLKLMQHGGDIIGKALKAHDVEFLFTLCGGHISPILIGAKNQKIRVIDVRDEVTAVFAADAVSRLTGTPGIVAVTAGPGITNTITAIKNAQMAESAVIILGGAAATVLKGRGSLQDIDQMALMKSIVKWAKRVKRVRDIPSVIEQAFEKSRSGVPGPVFVELPIDLLYPEGIVKSFYGINNGKVPKSLGPKLIQWYLNRRSAQIFKDGFSSEETVPKQVQIPQPSQKQVNLTINHLQEAERPVLIVGSQAMLNTGEVKQLQTAIEKLNIPTFLSGMARGLLGKNHPLHMKHKRRDALRSSDLVILAGVPPDFRLDYGRHINRKALLISINRSKATLKQNRLIKKAKLRAFSDPGKFLLQLSKQTLHPEIDWSEWYSLLKERNDHRTEEIIQKGEETTEFINPLNLAQEIENVIDDNSLLIGDGGDWVSTFSYIVQPRKPLRWLDPGAFGTLGSGAGFALGAKLTHPDTEVWLIYGDGSAGYSIAEFDTFTRHNIPVIAVVGNDASWTQIAREQIPLFDDDVATGLAHTDYHKVAEGFGAKGFLVKDISEVPKVLQQAKELVKEGKSVLINALIGKSDFRKGSLSM